MLGRQELEELGKLEFKSLKKSITADDSYLPIGWKTQHSHNMAAHQLQGYISVSSNRQEVYDESPMQIKSHQDQSVPVGWTFKGYQPRYGVPVEK